MLKVLDLFAGTQSVKRALIKMGVKHEYIGIDIYDPVNNKIVDLSAPDIIKKIKERLGGWKPDFIWASPLCTPFSRATSVAGGTLPYETVEGGA